MPRFMKTEVEMALEAAEFHAPAGSSWKHRGTGTRVTVVEVSLNEGTHELLVTYVEPSGARWTGTLIRFLDRFKADK